MIAANEQGKKWEAELERIGETAVRYDLELRSGVGVGITNEPMRQFTFRWLRQKEKDRERREHSAYWYTKWTFWAAVGAALIGVVGVLVTIFSGH